MRNLLWLPIALITLAAKAQETTFKTNGPDDIREGKHAFTNACIILSPTQKIDSGTLLITGGRIVAVLPAGKTTNLNGYTLHDCRGRFIYPSFVDVFTDYGIASPKPNRDNEGVQYENNLKGAYGWNQAIRSDFEAHKNFNINDSKAEEWRKVGFGVVLTHRKDGIARGTGAVVALGNEKENITLLKPNAAAIYSFNKGSSTQEYPSSLMGSIALLRQTYYDAQWYKNTPANLRPQEINNLTLEAWNASQTLPQIFDAGDWLHALRADKLGDEMGVQYILKGSGNEYQRIAEVAATKAKYIVPLNFPKAYDVEDPYKALWVELSDMQHWELAPTNAAVLQKAGVEFSLTTSDLEKKEDFLKNLRIAVKHGLKESDALRALTLNPASMLGLSHELGTLEAGKWANFFISSKNIFDEKAVLYENWIQGKRYEITKPEPIDIRGEYTLKIAGQRDSKLLVTGEQSAPKMQVQLDDTNKAEVKFSYSGNDISLNFNPDKQKMNNKYLLTGVIDHINKIWSGKAQLPDGQLLNWQAIYAKENAKDTTKPDKKDTIDLTKLSVVRYPFNAYGNEQMPVAKNYLFKNATVWTNEASGILKNTDVLIRDGKIQRVGVGLSCADCETVNSTNKHLTAGIIDEHCHIAISGGVNEGTKASSAEVRIGDVITSEDINIYRQLAGGVVAAQLLHGSANPIGGQSALVKFRWGYTPEKMKIADADGFIKFALGENVKQSNWGDKFRTRYPQSRMGVEQTYYNYFTKAKEYSPDKKHARRDLELEALKEIIAKKRFITCHSYVQSEINMLMHVADSFGFKVNTFTHILEGYKVADKMKAHGVAASTFADWWAYKYEVIDAIPHNAAILHRMGIVTAINSDDAEMARRLNQEAAKSVKYAGMSEEDAWKMVTLNPARMLHLDTHMGSIKAGKDADVVLWSDNPLSIYAKVEKTLVDGICFYDRAADAAKQNWIARERARIVQKMLEDKKAGAAMQEPVKKDNRAYSCGHEEE